MIFLPGSEEGLRGNGFTVKLMLIFMTEIKRSLVSWALACCCEDPAWGSLFLEPPAVLHRHVAHSTF